MQMKNAEIPGVNKPVSRVFFGTAIRPMTAGENVNGFLDEVLSSGVNAFDCARGYGCAENSLGRWIRDRGLREKVVVLTKCGDVKNGVVKVNGEVIRTELEQSLQNLETDYVDIYLLHRYDPNTPMEEYVQTLNEAKSQGKIRCFGVSNWKTEQIDAFNACAARRGLEGISVSSPNFGLTRQMQDPWAGECVSLSGPENAEARAWYARSKMPILAYSSLGRGFFSGKFRSFDYETARTVLDEPARRAYLWEENMKRLQRAEILAERDGCTVSEVALRYLFGAQLPVFAIISTTKPRTLESSVQAAARPLGAEDMEYLEKDD